MIGPIVNCAIMLILGLLMLLTACSWVDEIHEGFRRRAQRRRDKQFIERARELANWHRWGGTGWS